MVTAGSSATPIPAVTLSCCSSGGSTSPLLPVPHGQHGVACHLRTGRVQFQRQSLPQNLLIAGYPGYGLMLRNGLLERRWHHICQEMFFCALKAISVPGAEDRPDIRPDAVIQLLKPRAGKAFQLVEDIGSPSLFHSWVFLFDEVDMETATCHLFCKWHLVIRIPYSTNRSIPSLYHVGVDAA